MFEDIETRAKFEQRKRKTKAIDETFSSDDSSSSCSSSADSLPNQRCSLGSQQSVQKNKQIDISSTISNSVGSSPKKKKVHKKDGNMAKIIKLLEKHMMDQYQKIYDIFFSIIRERQSKLSSRGKEVLRIGNNALYQKELRTDNSQQSMVLNTSSIMTENDGIGPLQKTLSQNLQKQNTTGFRRQSAFVKPQMAQNAYAENISNEAKSQVGSAECRMSKQWMNVNSQLNLSRIRGETLEDYLYLPSSLTGKKKEAIIAKFGKEALQIDSEFEALIQKAVRDFQKILLEKEPELCEEIEGHRSSRQRLPQPQMLQVNKKELTPAQKRLSIIAIPNSRRHSGSSEDYEDSSLDSLPPAKINKKRESNLGRKTAVQLKRHQDEFEKEHKTRMNYYALQITGHINQRPSARNKTIDQSRTVEQQMHTSPSLANSKLLSLERSNESDTQRIQLKNEIADLKNQIDSLSKVKEQNEQLKADIQRLEGLTTKARVDKDEMRKTYHKDLMNYKTSFQNVIRNENAKWVDNKDRIQVSFFNQLTGLDDQTMKLVNEKIEDVKDQAENRIAKLIKITEEQNHRINAYKKMIPENFSMLDMTVEEVMANLPHVCSDTHVIWDLMHKEYGENCFSRQIVAKYSQKFSTNYEQLNTEMKKMRTEVYQMVNEVEQKYQDEILELRKLLQDKTDECIRVEHSMRAEAKQMVNQATKEGFKKAEVQFRQQQSEIFNKNMAKLAELHLENQQLKNDVNKIDFDKLKIHHAFMTMFIIGKFKKVLNNILGESEAEELLNHEKRTNIKMTIMELFEGLSGRKNTKFQDQTEVLLKKIQMVQAKLEKVESELTLKNMVDNKFESKIYRLQLALDAATEEKNVHKVKHENQNHQIACLQNEIKTLEESERFHSSLVKYLETEKFNILRMMRREVPQIYRKCKDDVFIENDILRKKIDAEIKSKIATSVKSLYRNITNNKMCQTAIRDLNLGLKQYKVKNVQEVDLEVAPSYEVGIQTHSDVQVFDPIELEIYLDDHVAALERAKSQSLLAKSASKDTKVEINISEGKRTNTLSPSKTQDDFSAYKSATQTSKQSFRTARSVATKAHKIVQCSILKPWDGPSKHLTKEVHSFLEQTKSLQARYSAPDPRDMLYLKKLKSDLKKPLIKYDDRAMPGVHQRLWGDAVKRGPMEGRLGPGLLSHSNSPSKQAKKKGSPTRSDKSAHKLIKQDSTSGDLQIQLMGLAQEQGPQQIVSPLQVLQNLSPDMVSNAQVVVMPEITDVKKVGVESKNTLKLNQSNTFDNSYATNPGTMKSYSKSKKNSFNRFTDAFTGSLNSIKLQKEGRYVESNSHLGLISVKNEDPNFKQILPNKLDQSIVQAVTPQTVKKDVNFHRGYSIDAQTTQAGIVKQIARRNRQSSKKRSKMNAQTKSPKPFLNRSLEQYDKKNQLMQQIWGSRNVAFDSQKTSINHLNISTRDSQKDVQQESGQVMLGGLASVFTSTHTDEASYNNYPAYKSTENSGKTSPTRYTNPIKIRNLSKKSKIMLSKAHARVSGNYSFSKNRKKKVVEEVKTRVQTASGGGVVIVKRDLARSIRPSTQQKVHRKSTISKSLDPVNHLRLRSTKQLKTGEFSTMNQTYTDNQNEYYPFLGSQTVVNVQNFAQASAQTSEVAMPEVSIISQQDVPIMQNSKDMPQTITSNIKEQSVQTIKQQQPSGTTSSALQTPRRLCFQQSRNNSQKVINSYEDKDRLVSVKENSSQHQSQLSQLTKMKPTIVEEQERPVSQPTGASSNVMSKV